MGKAKGPPADKITPYMFLGPLSSASNESFLKANGISHILSIGTTPDRHFDHIAYERLALNDDLHSDIESTVDRATAFIDSARSRETNVLLHCSAGISRSPTIATAYLVAKDDMSLKEALGTVVRARPQVSPNRGFITALKLIEERYRGSVSLDVDELPSRKTKRLALFE
jgi:atypical dual specificity phosphatase